MQEKTEEADTEHIDTQRNLLKKNEMFKKAQQARMLEEDLKTDADDDASDNPDGMRKTKVPPLISINQKKKRLYSVMKNGMYVFQQEDFEE